MAVDLDLADIQGNILSAYGKLGFPKGRYITLNVRDPAGGRKFVNALLPEITTALRWRSERSAKSAGRGPVAATGRCRQHRVLMVWAGRARPSGPYAARDAG